MTPEIIAFDADDTLFINEPYFEEAELKFCSLMQDYLSQKDISMAIYQAQITNLPLYGYGIKGYILSMIEAALEISNQTIPSKAIGKILDFGKDLLNKPIELIDGIEETLAYLHQKKYKIIVATKGDLKDQHRKLHHSGLGRFFHHIEVMSDKQLMDYQKLLERLETEPSKFLMIGNSLKSDVLPVLALGGFAVHVPFHTTWLHEKIDHEVQHPNFWAVQKVSEIPALLNL